MDEEVKPKIKIVHYEEKDYPNGDDFIKEPYKIPAQTLIQFDVDKAGRFFVDLDDLMKMLVEFRG